MKRDIVSDCMGQIDSAIGSINAQWNNLTKAERKRWQHFEDALQRKLTFRDLDGSKPVA